MTTADKPKRRWLRFSLRSLMLLMALIAVLFGWAIHKAREQGIAVAALKEMGCVVQYNDGQRSPTVLEWLRKLLGEGEFRSVTDLYGERSQITDAGLESLRGLTLLHELYLAETQVTDAGLVHLQGLSQLRHLELDRTHVTDAGLVNLKGLTQLELLYLTGTQVTDDGMAHLQGFTRLEYLALGETEMTDAGCSISKR